jgi:hypothetical protein
MARENGSSCRKVADGSVGSGQSACDHLRQKLR